MQKLLTSLLTITLSTSLYSEVLMSPTSASKDLYPNNILDGNYLTNVPKPMEFLGFNLGERVATPAQISSAILEWSKLSDRLKVVEYARSHEGRPLFSLFISSPANINNLDVIKENISKLADARETNDKSAKALISNMPAIAWMAYSIHGNETSGADAALGIIYHLIASDDPDIINTVSYTHLTLPTILLV